FRGDLPGKLALFTEDPGEVQAAAIVGQRFLRVALSVVEAYQERKRKAGVVDFQDLLVLARDLVRDHSTVQKSVLKRYRFLPLEAHHPQAYAGSCVEFLWSVPPEDAGESAGDVRAREADAIARRINELLAADEDRVLEETGLRRVRPGDVVLLFRSMSNVATY